jgi:hypothetical protein
MAIKGKGRSKSKGVARPPRREPVPIPTPFPKRRWVQVSAAFLLGLGIFMFGVWLTNGVRTSRQEDRAAEQRAAQQEIVQSYQAEVEAQIGKVGTLQEPQPPRVGDEIDAALKDLEKAGQTSVTVDDLESSAEGFGKAADAVDAYDLAAAISGQGLGLTADTLTTSKLQFVEGFRLYRTAALLTAQAIESADDPQTQDALIARATEVKSSADAVLGDGYRKLKLSLANVGLGQL